MMGEFHIAEETPHHFLLKHPSGHSIRIAKKALSEGMVSKIKKFAKGGQVNYGASTENTIDQDKAEAFKKSLGGQSGPANPKLSESKVQNPPKVAQYAEGTDEGGVSPEDAEGIPDVTADRQPAGMVQNIGEAIGKYGVTPVVQSAKDVAGAYKLLENKIGGGAHNLVTGIKKGAGVAQEPQAESNVHAASMPQQAGPQNISLGVNTEMPQAPQVPFIDPSKGYMQASNQIVGGLQGQAASAGVQGEAAAKTYEQQVGQQKELLDDYQTGNQDLDDEHQKLSQAVAQGHIDPERFFKNKSLFGQARTVLGLIVGGLGGGILRQENPALKFLNQQIDRDIEAQKTDLGSNKTLLEANLRQYGNHHDAYLATKAGMLAMSQGEIAKIAATQAGPMAKAQAQQAIGQIRLQLAPIQQELAIRQAVFKGMNSGGPGTDPAVAVRFLVPEKQQDEAYKELKSLQAMKKGGQNAVTAFDKVSQMTLGGAFSPKQAEALIEPIVAQLSTETAHRFTDTDAKMLRKLMPSSLDGPGTRLQKRQALIRLISEKMNSPLLQAHGIPVPQLTLAAPIASGPNFIPAGQQGQPQGGVMPISTR